jgi:hypothetical protein
MNIGQMLHKNTPSEYANYYQVDMCGKGPNDVLTFLNNKELKHRHIFLHGDWEKNGNSSNTILEEKRMNEYIDTVKLLQGNDYKILGLTLHPPTRSKKVNVNALKRIQNFISEKTNTLVLFENRSSYKFMLSTEDEIRDYLKTSFMTIDIPQLFISSGKNEYRLLDTLIRLDKDNIKEIHLANTKLIGKGTYVGRQLEDGEYNALRFFNYINTNRNVYTTLEILGGTPVFEQNLMKIQLYEKINSR